jgi:branched-chain amino acid transport system ATP-binding protein
MLSVRNLHVRYGAIAAVRGIDLEVNAGEIIALLGANGAGKSTTAKAIAGLLHFTGEIRFDGRGLAPGSAEHNLRLGIALVPEGRGILARMTVEENLQLGTYCRRDRKAAAADTRKMLERFPILAERRKAPANLLSGGEQQLLAIARACLARPRLLILDEPSLGLSPRMTTQVLAMIAELRAGGLTIMLVEQKARQTLKHADRAYLMETGRIIASGPASSLAADPVIARTFLGRTEDPVTGGGGALRE